MANVNIELGYKNLAWFNANPTLVLKEGQIVFLQQTGTYKIGDGVTALSVLSFLGVSSETQTLQNVTDLGNTTTNDIEANSFVKTGATSTDVLLGDGSTTPISSIITPTPTLAEVLAVGNSTGGNSISDTNLSLIAGNSIDLFISSGESEFYMDSTTAGLGSQTSIYLDAPSVTKNGIEVATINDIPTISGLVPYTGATNDVDLGEKELTTGKLWLYDAVGGPTEKGSLHYADEALHFENSDGETLLYIEPGFMQIHKDGTTQSNFFVTNLTANRDHYLPNASGTIALTSNIGSWGGLNYPTWTSGTPFVKMTASGTFTLDTNTYLTSITSSNVTTALGYTPYNSTNPSGYITSSALTPYAPLSNPTFTTAITTPLINGVSGLLQFKTTDNINIGNASTIGQRILRVGQGTGWVDIGNASDGTGNGFISFNQTTNTLANSALYGGAFSTVLNSNNFVAIRLGNGNQIAVNITNHVHTPSSASSGSIIPFTFTVPANTNQTLSTNTPNFKVTGANKQFATGTLATQYFNYFNANTLSFVGASTASEVFNVYFDITTAGTNATITKNYSAGFGGDIKVAGNVNTYIDGGYNLYNAAGNQFIGSVLRGSDASLLIEAAMVNLKLGAGGSAGDVLIYTSNATKTIRLSSTIGTYIGSNLTTAPTAKLHLGAGTATAGTAPLKLTAGTNLTTPENGAFEYDGTNLYFTVGGVRKIVTLI